MLTVSDTDILVAHELQKKETDDIVLIPQPTNDVNDPLNWPKWKKIVAFVTICFFSFLAGWVLGGISIGIPSIMKEFDVDLNAAVNGLISWAVFTLGIGVRLSLTRLLLIVELLLDSDRSLLREATSLSFRIIRIICHMYLVRGGEGIS